MSSDPLLQTLPSTADLPCSDDTPVLYPSGDGNPMAENTIQYRWIVMIKENLEILFAAAANVFIAGDLLWYPVPVETSPAPSQAPDVMVVFGVPKGDRCSYQQWKENNIPPQVVFEILSDSNRTTKGKKQLQDKFGFYQQYELVIYRPDGQKFLSFLELNQQLTQERLEKKLAQQREQETRQRADQLAAYLRSIGINPDEIAP